MPGVLRFDLGELRQRRAERVPCLEHAAGALVLGHFAPGTVIERPASRRDRAFHVFLRAADPKTAADGIFVFEEVVDENIVHDGDARRAKPVARREIAA